MESDESSSSLIDSNIFVIIKNDTEHDEFHHLKFRASQTNFPLRFKSTDIEELQNNGVYLVSLVIFGSTHQLLWEATIFRQHLKVNDDNFISFIVKDVCKRYFIDYRHHCFCLIDLISESTEMFVGELSMYSRQ